MQNWKYMYRRSTTETLEIHFGDRPNVVVANEVPLGPNLSNRRDLRVPDLMVIFDADADLIDAQRGFEIANHDNPPDFALEVASPTTGVADYTVKRADYERYRVFEYWRFDPSGGRYHDAALAGDRLVNGRYEPILVATMPGGEIRGYSEALGLYLCWDGGLLKFYDPARGEYLPTLREERVARLTAEARADREAVRRLAAETRMADMAAEIRRLRGE